MTRGMLFTAQMVSTILLAPGMTALTLARLLRQPMRSNNRVMIRSRQRAPRAHSGLYPAAQSRGLF